MTGEKLLPVPGFRWTQPELSKRVARWHFLAALRRITVEVPDPRSALPYATGPLGDVDGLRWLLAVHAPWPGGGEWDAPGEVAALDETARAIHAVARGDGRPESPRRFDLIPDGVTARQAVALATWADSYRLHDDGWLLGSAARLLIRWAASADLAAELEVWPAMESYGGPAKPLVAMDAETGEFAPPDGWQEPAPRRRRAMPIEQRFVLLARYLTEGATMGELAQELGVTVPAVHKHLHECADMLPVRMPERP